MPYVATNGIKLNYKRTGQGERVLMIMGSSASGRVWTMHQTPALNRAGYQTLTFDNRGIAPSDVPPGDYTLEEMVADTVGLIEALDFGPCHIVGTSLGAMIAQVIAADRPDLVTSAVLIGTRARSDAFRRALSRADRTLASEGVRLPPAYEALTTVTQMLSPATLLDDTAVTMWLDLLELTAGESGGGGQSGVDTHTDRRPLLSRIAVPCRVISFTDDLVTPAALGAEVAAAIPGCDHVEIPSCGHWGYLERPDEVNRAILTFLNRSGRQGPGRRPLAATA
ncbi:pimeloyl-ACP methyl ester carboxylesterase [Streptacidiphilus sp. MAP12-33]|uniref:alpha/beta fold hydrolase n=1 Tax=Streptacidiphilus sp. MAP12-33 TaxID=3156266 RepID=UPI0035148D65